MSITRKITVTLTSITPDDASAVPLLRAALDTAECSLPPSKGIVAGKNGAHAEWSVDVQWRWFGMPFRWKRSEPTARRSRPCEQCFGAGWVKGVWLDQVTCGRCNGTKVEPS